MDKFGVCYLSSSHEWHVKLAIPPIIVNGDNLIIALHYFYLFRGETRFAPI